MIWQHSLSLIREPDADCDCTTCAYLREVMTRGRIVRRIEVEDRIADELLTELNAER